MPEEIKPNTFTEVHAQIDRDLGFLLDGFREVLRSLGEYELADLLSRVESGQITEAAELDERSIQALSMYFQFMNMVEENVANEFRRSLEEVQDGMIPGLWNHRIQQIMELGFSPEELCDGLQQIVFEPVLTAHPTESKPAQILIHHRELYLLLLKSKNPRWSSTEKKEIRSELLVNLERLWRTGEVLSKKPEVLQELQGIMHYVRRVFPQTLHRMDSRLKQAFLKNKIPESLHNNACSYPRLKLGNWVGGDRDGHPYVTADVTQQALAMLRSTALQILTDEFENCASKLTLTRRFHPVPEELKVLINENMALLPEHIKSQLQEFREEPWKQALKTVMSRLPHLTEWRKFNDTRTHEFKHPSELIQQLLVINQTLQKIGADRIANQDVFQLIRTAQCFGFHGASMDIRQNSAFHERALQQLIHCAGIDLDWIPCTEEERLAWLDTELKSPRPFTHYRNLVGDEADQVYACYRNVRKFMEHNSSDCMGSLIISMTRSLSDLLTVYLLTREAGLAVDQGQGLTCRLPIVPLFETIDDLQHSAEILDSFLSHPVTVRSLEYQRKQTGQAVAQQQVMIGYSDSCKDGGILASQWNLHLAQSRLLEVGQKHGVKILFFHGRGGTVSRGAGPMDRFLEALPPGSLGGQFRMTEQGETIAQKYANLLTATTNIEISISGVAFANFRDLKQSSDQKHFEAAELLADVAQHKYQDFLSDPDFIDFFNHATPIDAIELCQFGSRPSRRKGRQSLDDLRAIPWVFSWNQSRFYLPGWYGVGTALSSLKETRNELWEDLKENIRTSPFLSYVLLNVDTSLASANLELMVEYSKLWPNEEKRERLMGLVVDELKLCRDLLNELFGGSLTERRHKLTSTLSKRDAALRQLHLQQIRLLRKFRHQLKALPNHEKESLLLRLMLTINAIASGERTTG